MRDHLSSLRTPQFPATSGRLVLWEQTRSWTRWFLNQIRQSESRGGIDQKSLANRAIFVASSGELRAAVENHPASFVFAEVTIALFRDLVGQIPRFRQFMPRLRIAVVCFELSERSVDESNSLDALFREAGATAVLTSQRDLSAMIAAVLTHFADLPQLLIGRGVQ